MNNNGQVVFFTFMIAIVIIILALAFVPAVKQFTETARNSGNLDCSNESISNFNKLACVSTDAGSFYFIIGLIFLAGTIIGARVVFSQ